MKHKNPFFRFFDVFTYVPKEHLKNLFHGVFMGLFTIATLELFQDIFQAIETKNTQETYFFIGIYLGISIFILVLRLLPFLRKIGRGNIVFLGSNETYKEYLKKYVSADGNSVEKIGTGKFVSIFDRGLSTWFDMAYNITYFGSLYIIIITYSIGKIFSISMHAGCIALLFLIVGFIGSTWANFKMREKRMIRYDAQIEVNRGLVRVLMSKNELLQNNQLGAELDYLGKEFHKAAKAQQVVAFWFNVLEEIPRFLFALLRIGVYLYLLKKVIDSGVDLSKLSIFITIMVMMDKAMNDLLQITRNFLKDIGLVEKFWNVFDNIQPIKGYETGSTFKKKQGNIEIKDITYTYEKKPVFKDFSLTIKQGEKTALVGLSGAGKTTLIKLIAGYIHPQSGYIEIMGNRLDKTALKSYYPHIGYLTQEPGVFDATIKENLIASAGQDVSEGEIFKALEDAKCDFIKNFTDGINTEIGERGIRLSGGQKQRLAIAKIFLKNPEIILLDEPTSALDSFSEEAISEALENLFRGRTVIIVAHRLQTVKKSDDIIVLENGEVIERGTHSELVKKKGIYKRMLDLQSGF